MMELMAESFTIRCHECGEVITIYKDDLDVEISFYDHGENGMGDETIYDIQHEMECPECGNRIELAITGNEYPVGAYDYDNAEIFGADFIEVPSMGMVYYQDEFDIDQNAVEATGIHGLIARISADRDLIYDVSPREFEEIVEQVLRDDGFDTRLTQPTRDGGRDIIATKTGINLSRTEMTELMEYIFGLEEVKRAVSHMAITHISNINRVKEEQNIGTIPSERKTD